MIVNILSQKYSGDITIVPANLGDLVNSLNNPTPEMTAKATLKGERATWPSNYQN